MDEPLEPARILVTGSCTWSDRNAVEQALINELRSIPFDRIPWERPVVLVTSYRRNHLNKPAGAELMADDIWRGWQSAHQFCNFLTPERHFNEDFCSSTACNLHMIRLGAEVCISFVDKWVSPSAHCARAARNSGIRVVDYGISTVLEDKPIHTWSWKVAA